MKAGDLVYAMSLGPETVFRVVEDSAYLGGSVILRHEKGRVPPNTDPKLIYVYSESSLQLANQYVGDDWV